MEIHARTTLIGAFVLAVIASVFGFVFWLTNGGGIGQRALYRIRYEKSVAGLLKGSAVLFNGVRVGEVTALQIEPSAPRQIMVTINVDARTPVRNDTRASINFQGLSGAPAVALSGGAAEASAPQPAAGLPPLLIADSVNAEPLRNAIASIDQFAAALARNSGRVDGIMAGVEKMTGGAAKAPPSIVPLAAANSFAGLARVPTGQLLVPEPTTLTTLDMSRLQIQGAPLPGAPDIQFPDALPRVVQMRAVQSFENAGYLRALGHSPDGVAANFQLLLDIRRFGVVSEDQRRIADIEYGAKILSNDGRILDARIIRAREPIAGDDVTAVGAAFDKAFGQTLSELTVWACGAIVAIEAEQKPKKPNAALPARPGGL